MDEPFGVGPALHRGRALDHESESAVARRHGTLHGAPDERELLGQHLAARGTPGRLDAPHGELAGPQQLVPVRQCPKIVGQLVLGLVGEVEQALAPRHTLTGEGHQRRTPVVGPGVEPAGMIMPAPSYRDGKRACPAHGTT